MISQKAVETLTVVLFSTIVCLLASTGLGYAFDREMKIQDELNRQWASGNTSTVLTEEQVEEALARN